MTTIPPPHVAAPRATLTPLRWFVAIIAIVYGFAKLNGSQFTVLDSELTRPMGEVSGFWLTWYYFGKSAIYGNLIALVQIGGGLLLAMPATALIGALVLLPIFVNIVLVDVFFGVDFGATILAAVVLLMLVSIVRPHVTRLLQAALLDPGPAGTSRYLLRAAALAIILGGGWILTWWAANYNNRVPTRIDGVWSVVHLPGGEASRWERVFFEHNRAYWVVFRTADGADERHHFEVDDGGTIRVWQTWLSKGDLMMQGRLTPDDRIELAAADGVHDRMVLERAHQVRGLPAN